MRIRRCCWLALALPIIVGLCSCSPPRASKADLVGVWAPDRRSQARLKGSADRARCEIVLRSDGTVSATMPAAFGPASDPASWQLVKREGVWSRRTSWDGWPTSIGEVELELHGGDMDRYTSLMIEPDRGSQRLFFWVGDPDSGDRFTFTRIRRDAPAPSP